MSHRGYTARQRPEPEKWAEQALSRSFRGPRLRSVQKAHQFDWFGPRPHAVDDDERRAADDQFARLLHATRAAQVGVRKQLFYLVLDAVAQLDSRPGVVLGDVVELRITAGNLSGQPLKPQAPSRSTRLTRAALFFAQLAFASSCDTHSAAGSSASSIPFATSALNHLS